MKKICFVTGTRAEFGLLRPLIKALQAERDFVVQTVVTGAHLSPEFGLTYKEIESSQVVIDEKIEMLLSSDTEAGIVKSMGVLLIGLADAFRRLSPSYVVLLGDRYETLGAATAAVVCRIPIIHLHGGELTLAAIDDSFRHSITKMSYLHLTAAEVYRRRVIQMGESPDRVFAPGALGIDNVANSEFLSKKELQEDLGIQFRKRNIIVTYHPTTLAEDGGLQEFSNLLEVLGALQETSVIFTKANADAGGREINGLIDEFAENHPENTYVHISLGQTRYLSLMRFMDGVVGNSSSGIIEASSLHVGTVNIGNRQSGRVRAESVIDCEGDVESIRAAFETLYSPEFRKKLPHCRNPYGDGRAVDRIVRIIRHLPNVVSTKKEFYDYPADLSRQVSDEDTSEERPEW